MELFKNLFKSADDLTNLPGKPEELERHFVKSENISAEEENGIEEIKRNYAEAVKSREDQYDLDIEANPKMKNERLNLRPHNGIVLGYADELVKEHNLSEEDKVAVYLGVILHDCGKLASLKEDKTDHHTKGVDYARKMLNELKPIKQGDEIIEITPELKEKVSRAVERHMNHPYMIFLNGGRFPEPENDIEKIVSDSDMLANVGFKNVCFRLNEKNLNIDIEAAAQKGIPALEETFNNVMSGVSVLNEYVHTKPAIDKIKELIEATVKIFEYLKANQVFQTIQDKYSEDNEFNFQTIEKRAGVQELKKELNQAIYDAAKASGVGSKMVRNFIM